jgi:hypothetical protein
MAGTFGVAILANDRICDWLLPFLESYREHNPTLPTYLIPFDRRLERTRRAAAAYDVHLIEADLEPVDRLAWHLYPFYLHKFRRRLRKLHSFALPLDEVLYIDVDTIVFRDFTPLFGHIAPGETEFIIASTSPTYVYNARGAAYPDLANAVRFSDGFFIAAPRLISRESVIATMRRDRRLFREVRKPHTFAQCVTNFAVHRLGLRIRTVTDLHPEASCETFYQAKGIDFGPGGPRDVDGRDIYFAHWAGVGSPPAHTRDSALVFDPIWRDYAARAARRVVA